MKSKRLTALLLTAAMMASVLICGTPMEIRGTSQMASPLRQAVRM